MTGYITSTFPKRTHASNSPRLTVPQKALRNAAHDLANLPELARRSVLRASANRSTRAPAPGSLPRAQLMRGRRGFQESLSLDNFMLRSELLVLEEQLCEAGNDAKRIKLVENFLLLHITHTEPDPLVLSAITLIIQSRGDIRIRELMEKLNISQSPLEKRFRKVVGASPKKFATIVRARNVLVAMENGKHDYAEYLSAFYDQAHFIKSFKKFAGVTPEQYLKRLK